MLLCICGFVFWWWGTRIENAYEPHRDLWVEFGGLTLDVLFVLVIFSLFENRRLNRQEKRRQQEIISDFGKWDSDESKYRIAGAIRRLNRLGKHGIDFRGLELRGFSFSNHDIKDIEGSCFYDGTWGTRGRLDRVRLDNVDFTRVKCTDVVFSRVEVLLDIVGMDRPATFRDCSFVEADLSGAVFDGALIEWTEEHPVELGEWAEAGQGFDQTHIPPFDGAEFAGASFKLVRFKNADFRLTNGLLECDFRGAKGLETCLFDDDETKDAVIRMALEKGKRTTREVE
ncbi:MAG: pentapeptide repeat-containing protein [Gemmatimonadetes bacterium]|nr:pentapeptide repeat-containing protein [Gemmatimonadota bacterium]